MPSQKQINDALWSACDALRGPVDPAEYKDFVLPMIFYKYASDYVRDQREGFEAQYAGRDDAEQLVARKLGRLPLQVPAGASFYDIFEGTTWTDADGEPLVVPPAEHNDQLGETLNTAFAQMEEANGERLDNVFQGVDFNSDAKLGETRERNERLRALLRAFNRDVLDLRPSKLESVDLVGEGYMYLIEKFAETAGKKGGEFFTPPTVTELLATVLDPKPGERIYDPTLGSASLAIAVAEHVRKAHKSDDFSLWGQEVNSRTWSLAQMNAVLHDLPGAHFERGDTLASPKHLKDGALMQFDVVVANPPFSLKDWGYKRAAEDKDYFDRYHRGLPPKTRGDFGFISHMIASAAEDGGRVGVVVALGVLFRGGAEGRIRQALVEEGLLEAVIGLPEKLFYGTGIPAAILLFRKGRGTKDVLFIDASAEEHFQAGTRQNKLTEDAIKDIAKTVQAFRDDPEGFEDVDKYAHRATLAEIEENGFNLNIPRYVDTYEPEPEVDLKKVQGTIRQLERELAAVREEMAGALDALGLSFEDDEADAVTNGHTTA